MSTVSFLAHQNGGLRGPRWILRHCHRIRRSTPCCAGPHRFDNNSRNRSMKYVCLVYGEESDLHAMSKAELATLDAESVAYDRSLAEARQPDHCPGLAVGQALQVGPPPQRQDNGDGRALRGNEGTAVGLRHDGGRQPRTWPSTLQPRFPWRNSARSKSGRSTRCPAPDGTGLPRSGNPSG